MTKSKRRVREQKSKSEKLPERIRAEVNRAGSGAAGPHKVVTTYSRKSKHKNREEY